MIYKKLLVTLCVLSILFVVVFILIPNQVRYNEKVKCSISMVNSCSENNRIVVSWDGYCKKSNKLILNIYENELLYKKVAIKKQQTVTVFWTVSTVRCTVLNW